MKNADRGTDRGTSTRPLAVTADPHLAEALARLAAAAGVGIEIVRGVAAARARWSAAPLVLVGAEMALDAARDGLPRRDGVALVGRDQDDGSVWQRGSAVGAQQVLILPDAERWLVGMLASASGPEPEAGPVVAVMSGRGGAGASTLAAALALSGTRRGLRSTLVDLDPNGGGIDLLFGLETEPGPRWSELAQWRDGRLCGRSLRDALPTYAARSRHGLAAGLGFATDGADGLPVLAWPRTRPGAPESWPEADGPTWDGLWPGDATDADGHSLAAPPNPLWPGDGAGPDGHSLAAPPDPTTGSPIPGRRNPPASETVPNVPKPRPPQRAGGERPSSDPSLPVLTWPRARTDVPLPTLGPESVRTVVGALARASDLVVVDLPRTLDEATVEALALATVTLMVVPAEVRAVAAASHVAAAVGLITPDVRVVVRLPAPGGLAPIDITDVMGGLPLAGVLGADRRLSVAAEHGEPPGLSSRSSVSAFCRTFLDELTDPDIASRRAAESRVAA